MKKAFALLLALSFVLASLPVFAFSSEEREIRIASAEDLCALSVKCVSDAFSENLRVVLTSDIDLTGVSFEPIAQFAGVFDGKGHKITGFRTDENRAYNGFFRRILPGGTVQNLIVYGSVNGGDDSVFIGGIAGSNAGIVKNCLFSGEVHARKVTGGICGENEVSGIVDSCSSYGNVSAMQKVGGICGENEGVIRSCVNRAKVNADMTDQPKPSLPGSLTEIIDLALTAEEQLNVSDVGGIAGCSKGVIRACDNGADIGHEYVGYNVGGIAGRVTGYVEDCKNGGAVFGRKDVGGITGQVDPETSWSFSNDKLRELKRLTDELIGEAQLLNDELGQTSGTLFGSFVSALGALSNVSDAIGELSDDAVEFVNGNIESVNLLSKRIKELSALAVPVTESLEHVLAESARSAAGLSDAFSALNETVSVTYKTFEAISSSLISIQNGLSEARELSRSLPTQIGTFINSEDKDPKEFVASLLDTLKQINEKLEDARRESEKILPEISSLDQTEKPVKEMLSSLEEFTSGLSNATEHLAKAQGAVTEILDTAARYDAIAFKPINDNVSARNALFVNLGMAFLSLRTAAAALQNTTLAQRVGAMLRSIDAISDFVTEELTGVRTLKDLQLIKDVSYEDPAYQNGRISRCENVGAIQSENNAGGIVGAVTVDFGFDPEDEYNLSSILSGNAEYRIYASIDSCRNTGGVTVKKEAAGGIAGKMDYGAMRECSSAADITAYDRYAGGCAGLSAGVIILCGARCIVNTDQYAGGVAGSAKDLDACISLSRIVCKNGYRGSIAGDANGQLSENYYASFEGEDAPGAVNGFDLAGKAEKTDYETLKELMRDDVVRTVSLTFIDGDGNEISIMLSPGSELEELPSVPDRDGKKWSWIGFDPQCVTFNRTVRGSYEKGVSVLSFGSEPAIILVQGDFTSEQKLNVSEFANKEAVKRQIAAYNVEVSDCNDELTVRYKTEKNGVLYLLTAKGELQKASYRRDGGYVVFTMRNGGTFFLADAFDARPFIFAGAALFVLAGGVLVTVLLIKKKKKNALSDH